MDWEGAGRSASTCNMHMHMQHVHVHVVCAVSRRVGVSRGMHATYARPRPPPTRAPSPLFPAIREAAREAVREAAREAVREAAREAVHTLSARSKTW